MSDSSAKPDSAQPSVRTKIADHGKSNSKQPFKKPKLTFVAPKLVKHGEVTELTGFFGAFSP